MKTKVLKIFLVFLIGVMFGYAWHYHVAKRYTVSERNCAEFLANNSYLYNRAQYAILQELFSNAQNRGDVFIYYDEDGRGYKIRRIK
jgi:hypothetical protein